MIISHRHRFIFVHTMKTAGDSISDSVKPVLGKGDFIIQNDFQAFMRRMQGRSSTQYRALEKHSTALEIRSCVSEEMWDEYFTFAFVRHPVTWAISLYNYMARKAAERDRLLLRNAWYLTPRATGVTRTVGRRWRRTANQIRSHRSSAILPHPRRWECNPRPIPCAMLTEL